MSQLNKTVVAGGVVYPAGTAYTEELGEVITNPAHWGRPAAAPSTQSAADLAVRVVEVEGALAEQVALVETLKAQLEERDDRVHELEQALMEATLAAPAEIEDYSALQVADLEERVEQRNEGRSDEDKIVVGGKGNKPDLIAALQSDDAAQAQKD